MDHRRCSIRDMTIGYPKPPKTEKKEYHGLQRRTPLQAKTTLKAMVTKKAPAKRGKKGGSKPIPEAVMAIVRARSRGYDEMDKLPGANQGHHIKKRSQGGMDIPINILHVSERNHPYRLHEDATAIAQAATILEDRIDKLFGLGHYTPETVAYLLQTIKPDKVLRQIQKGFLKASISPIGYVIDRESIKSWLMP